MPPPKKRKLSPKKKAATSAATSETAQDAPVENVEKVKQDNETVAGDVAGDATPAVASKDTPANAEMKVKQENTNTVSTTTTVSTLLTQHKTALQSFLTSIEDLTAEAICGGGDDSCATGLLFDSSMALSDLKSLQRMISLRVVGGAGEVGHERSDGNTTSHAARAIQWRNKVEECSLKLENLNYEKNYLKGEIGVCRGWRGEELERMSWEELGLDPGRMADGSDGNDVNGGNDGNEGESSNVGGDSEEGGDEEMKDVNDANDAKDANAISNRAKSKRKITTAEEAIDAYLLPHSSPSTDASHHSHPSHPPHPTHPPHPSHRNLQNHPHILRKLHSDLRTRSTLVHQLSAAQSRLKELQTQNEELRGCLKEIPRRVAELEGVCEGWNGVFGGRGVDSGGGSGVGGVGGSGVGGSGSSVCKSILDGIHPTNDDTVEDSKDGKDVKDSETKDNPPLQQSEQLQQSQKLQAATLLIQRPSSQRNERFQLAKSNLPSPLYVLYVQLVGYLDAWSSLELLEGEGDKCGNGGNGGGNGGNGGSKQFTTKSDALGGFMGASGMDVRAVPPTNEKDMKNGQNGQNKGNGQDWKNGWSVILSLSPEKIIPSEVSTLLGKSSTSSTSSNSSTSSTSSTIQIVFSYDANQGVVYAHLNERGGGSSSSGGIGGSGGSSGSGGSGGSGGSSGSSILEMGLLDNLFPGDDGSVNPNLAVAMLKNEDENDENGETDENGDDEAEAEEKGEKGENGEDTSGAAEEGDHSSTLPGKPYYWCQIMAGLSFPPPSSATHSYPVPEETGDGREPISPTAPNAPTTPTEPPFQTQICTKAVFRQLLRRIRERRTLSAILDLLGRRSSSIPHPLPIHPVMRGGVGGGEQAAQTNQTNQTHQTPVSKAKLHSWTEDAHFAKHMKHRGSGKRRYIATIKRKSSILKASVIVDVENYPVEPPVWSFQDDDDAGSSGSSGASTSWGERHGTLSSLQTTATAHTISSTPSTGTGAHKSNASHHLHHSHHSHHPPLFDGDLHRIQCHINHNLEQFIHPPVEATYDWILLHQLVDAISCWEEVMIAGEGGKENSKSNYSKDSREEGVMMGYPRRVRKGRDRRLVGFGQRSPFFWYRNGL